MNLIFTIKYLNFDENLLVRQIFVDFHYNYLKFYFMLRIF